MIRDRLIDLLIHQLVDIDSFCANVIYVNTFINSNCLETNIFYRNISFNETIDK